MSVCLRSAVMDTDLILSTIDDSRRSETAVFDPSESDHGPIAPNTHDCALDEPAEFFPNIGVVGVTLCPQRNRAASAAVKATAGMPSSAVSMGSRYPKADELCRCSIAESSEIACSTVKHPTERRRNSATWLNVPSAAPRSRARARM